MALSQNLEDSPGWKCPRPKTDCELPTAYKEQHRLALEALVSGGAKCFLEFLKRERLPSFLSAAELQGILSDADATQAVTSALEDSSCEQNAAGDGSSLTYFPEVSDVEPPLLELGWPAFTAGSFRGVTRAVAHFQPAYEGSVYRCKEAICRMIRSAKEVIAIVTDSLTDLDIFHDLREATLRRVPVYIVLDQRSLSEFLQMCKSLHVRLDELKHMRVRTITGSTYYLRSGARITGKVHERFMLIDGNRVATGSYRFNWTDGKLNSSNLVELSGQITEGFDEEFRILYAQSLPVVTSAASSFRNCGLYDNLLLKTPETSKGRGALSMQAYLTSTPNITHTQQSRKSLRISKEDEEENRIISPGSDRSTLRGDMEQELRQEDIVVEALPVLSTLKTEIVESHSVRDMTSPAVQISHISTQTSPTKQDMVQTGTKQSTPSISSSSSPSSSSSTSSSPSRNVCVPKKQEVHNQVQNTNLRECYRKLAAERQLHYTSIRSKLEHMMLLLARRHEHVGLSLSSSLPRVSRGSANAVMEGALNLTWPRARGVQ
ncbi:protein FAM83D [Hoplias malabaricus]|uniref:protein FAM83D n=1 Tax=Hoplias malabaricus TaxID=27720 RepID=UPI003462D180